METISEDAHLAVKRGIYWLDEAHPGWATRIDLTQLDMSECRDCVIGQAIGSYTDTTIKASGNIVPCQESIIWAIEHGFESPHVSFYDTHQLGYVTYGYNDLETLWSEEVQRRLG